MKITRIIETAKDNNSRLCDVNPAEKIGNSNVFGSIQVELDPAQEFQKITGFGGALTEASAFVLNKLSQKNRTEVLNAYFKPEGQGNAYTLARTHLNSCDFSLENWDCVDTGDESLESFDLKRADKYLTPLIQDSIAAADGDLKIMITPWSPPAWMKTNNKMNNGGKLKPEYYPLWASYVALYLKHLKDRNIDIWSMSIQNEPAAVQTWDSCEWTAEEEAEFAVTHLHPALKKHGFEDTEIYIWDHNRDLLWDRIHASMQIPGAREIITGAAFHWYSGDQYNHLDKVREAFPEKALLFTEGCIEGGPRLGAWFVGERYAHNIINDLNHGCNGWIDWNIALDLQGGPNHVSNFCDAPVLVDTEADKYHLQSSYYYLGHFSRFVKPGAVRIGCKLNSGMVPSTVDGTRGTYIEATAFRNPNGEIALVFYNRTEDEINYSIRLGTEQALVCPPRSIQTIIISTT
ncbi:glycoside hydrolase family 30 protein [Spirochaeta dissipatitropha]